LRQALDQIEREARSIVRHEEARLSEEK
jgi:hypothetical protein